MNRSKIRKNKNSQLPLFIRKLLEMVEDTTIESIISWTGTGDAFNIKSVSKFTEQVLPRYFKHKNFSSFIRQLNMYGFRKIRHNQGENVYMNDHFRVGGRHQLRNISRRIKEQKEERMVVYHQNGRDRGTVKELNQLKSKQKSLEQMCKHFLVQNQRLMQENQNLVKRMENQCRQKQKRMQDFLLMVLSQAHTKELTSNSTDPILSIGNGQVSKENNFQRRQMSPLQAIASNLQHSEQFHKIKSLIEGVYGRKNHYRRDNNYTYVNSTGVKSQEELSEIHHQQSDVGLTLEKDDDGFLSIHNFMDADDFQQEINLEESR